MLSITIRVIPHLEQRYPTVGDYIIDRTGRGIQIFVSDMNNWRYEALVAIHELVEVLVACFHNDIQEEDITRFDIQFEKERERNLQSKDAEPGDDARAPYRREHFLATTVERIVALALGVDWKLYDETVVSL